jgi:hypothetical protein
MTPHCSIRAYDLHLLTLIDTSWIVTLRVFLSSLQVWLNVKAQSVERLADGDCLRGDCFHIAIWITSSGALLVIWRGVCQEERYTLEKEQYSLSDVRIISKIFSTVALNEGLQLYFLNSEDNSHCDTCAYEHLQVYPLPLSQRPFPQPLNRSVSS